MRTIAKAGGGCRTYTDYSPTLEARMYKGGYYIYEDTQTERTDRGERREPIRVADIVPYLPKVDCFFDSRHWVVEDISKGGCLPFALTTRVEANHQQYVRLYED